MREFTQNLKNSHFNPCDISLPSGHAWKSIQRSFKGNAHFIEGKLTLSPLMWIVLTLKSTPMVAACSGSKASSVNLKSSEDLPTLLSPMISSFNVVSNWSTSMIKFAKLRTFTWNFGAELWDFVFVLVSQKCQKIKWRKRLNSLPIAETALFRTVADWHMALKYWWDESQFLRHTKSVAYISLCKCLMIY